MRGARRAVIAPVNSPEKIVLVDFGPPVWEGLPFFPEWPFFYALEEKQFVLKRIANSGRKDASGFVGRSPDGNFVALILQGRDVFLLISRERRKLSLTQFGVRCVLKKGWLRSTLSVTEQSGSVTKIDYWRFRYYAKAFLSDPLLGSAFDLHEYIYLESISGFANFKHALGEMRGERSVSYE